MIINPIRVNYSFSFLLSATALILSAALWTRLPAHLPIHFSLEGDPNLYAPKELLICLLPAASLFSIWLIPYFIRGNSGGSRHALSSQIVLSFSIAANGIYLGILLGTVFSNNQYTVLSINLCLGIILICIGRIFRKAGRNFVFGIRTSWALASEENWFSVHHIASRLMVGSGTLLILFSVFLTTFKLAVALIVTSVLGPILYTHFQFKRIR